MFVCPNCGSLIMHGLSFSDSGEPDCIPGMVCSECDEFATEDEWDFAYDQWDNEETA